MTDGPAAHLMVVDDDPAVRMLVAATFEPEGWQVTEASGAAQALGLLREPPFPDVVLLDVTKPALDGVGVLAELRDARGTIDLPVVLMSATEGPLTSRLATSMGADLVTKPFDAAALRSLCAMRAAQATDEDEMIT